MSWRTEAGGFSLGHLAEVPQSGRCLAVRIFDWLFYRGTIDCYQAPILNARLRDELIGLYRPRPDDLPAESAGADEIATFRTAHLGWSLLPEEAPPPTTAPSRGDYRQPDRQAFRESHVAALCLPDGLFAGSQVTSSSRPQMAEPRPVPG
ncbi:hypothetical protein [Streptomyces sp. NPDC050804]|uniref:hypothetical protein n=1 Tax=Streptomyces sp. NPDC050804 TaxID=3154745 RepID=UPI00342AED3D